MLYFSRWRVLTRARIYTYMPKLKIVSGQVVDSSDVSFPEKRKNLVTQILEPTGRKVELWQIVLQTGTSDKDFVPARVSKYLDVSQTVANPLYELAQKVKSDQSVKITFEGSWDNFVKAMNYKKVVKIEII